MNFDWGNNPHLTIHDVLDIFLEKEKALNN